MSRTERIDFWRVLFLNDRTLFDQLWDAADKRQRAAIGIPDKNDLMSNLHTVASSMEMCYRNSGEFRALVRGVLPDSTLDNYP
jgi:hypothetical protein